VITLSLASNRLKISLTVLSESPLLMLNDIAVGVLHVDASITSLLHAHIANDPFELLPVRFIFLILYIQVYLLPIIAFSAENSSSNNLIFCAPPSG
jgi:hypothetical protein